MDIYVKKKYTFGCWNLFVLCPQFANQIALHICILDPLDENKVQNKTNANIILRGKYAVLTENQANCSLAQKLLIRPIEFCWKYPPPRIVSPYFVKPQA